MSDINPWMPEPNTLIHQLLGKMAEECSELSKIAVRCMIQGIDECDPGTGEENRTELLKEIADVEATICWAFEVITFADMIGPRQRRKLDGFHEWQKMIEARATPEGATAAPDDEMVDRLCCSRYSAFYSWSDELRTEERYRMKAALTAALRGEGQ